MRASWLRFGLATLVAWVAATVADFIFNAVILGQPGGWPDPRIKA